MGALTYIGPNPAHVGVVPLPEGWPALNHDEPDADVLAAKVASGAYRKRRAGDGDEPDYAPAPLAVSVEGAAGVAGQQNDASQRPEAPESL